MMTRCKYHANVEKINCLHCGHIFYDPIQCANEEGHDDDVFVAAEELQYRLKVGVNDHGLVSFGVVGTIPI